MFTRDFRRFAPIGLIISGVSVLVSFGLFIVRRTFDLPLQISLGMIIVGLALFILLDPQRALQALTGRQARYGSNSLLMTIAFIGIIVVINYLVYNNSKQWDFTEDKQNTLTAETLQTLSSLQSKVKAEAYYTARTSSTEAERLLRNYEANSSGNFSYEFIDPEQDPIRTQQAQVTRDGTIVLMMEDRQEQITYASEEDLTSGLVRLMNPGSRTVYFLTGHGEYPSDSSEDVNYSQVASSLKAKNYTVATLNLAANPSIPEDALAVIIVGPQKPVTQQEASIIQEYVNAGGSLVYLTEPRPVTQFGDEEDPLATYLNDVWGISVDEDVIIDLSQSNDQPLTVVSNRFSTHAITEKMYSYVLVMPTVRSVRLNEVKENLQVTELAHTTESAWGETDIVALQNNQASPDEASDLMGPIPFAVSGENQTTNARVVVIGDSDFGATGYYDQLGNSDFIINSIDWAAQQDSLISLTPREQIERIMLTPGSQTMGLVLLGSVFVIPGLVLFTGIIVWVQRRKRG